MSERKMGVEGFHEHWMSESKVATLTSHEEYLEWKNNITRKVQRDADIILNDEDGARGFLLDAGWIYRQPDTATTVEYDELLDKVVPKEVNLVPPYYYVMRYDTLRDAVEIELFSQEYCRFRQDKLEEIAKNVPTRNCVFDRG